MEFAEGFTGACRQKMDALGQLTAGAAGPTSQPAMVGAQETLAETIAAIAPKTARAAQAIENRRTLDVELLMFSRRLNPEPISSRIGSNSDSAMFLCSGLAARSGHDRSSGRVADHRRYRRAGNCLVILLVINSRDAMTDGGTVTSDGAEHHGLARGYLLPLASMSLIAVHRQWRRHSCFFFLLVRWRPLGGYKSWSARAPALDCRRCTASRA